MKFLLFIGLIACMYSCNVDNDRNNLNFTYELVPIDSVQIPDTLYQYQHYNFKIFYKTPSSCHSFAYFDYIKNVNERKIGVVNTVLDNKNCKTLTANNSISEELKFLVERDDYYIFKFWQGIDENGKPIYLTKEVPVEILSASEAKPLIRLP